MILQCAVAARAALASAQVAMRETERASCQEQPKRLWWSFAAAAGSGHDGGAVVFASDHEGAALGGGGGDEPRPARRPAGRLVRAAATAVHRGGPFDLSDGGHGKGNSL